MTVSPTESGTLSELPDIVWAQTLNLLSLDDTKSLWKTCENARELIREHMSDEAVAEVAERVLRIENFSLLSVQQMPLYHQHREFVCNAIRMNSANYGLTSPPLQKDPTVVKTALVAQSYSGGISTKLEQTALDIHAGPFLNSLRSLASLPTVEVWRERGLGALFGFNLRSFRQRGPGTPFEIDDQSFHNDRCVALSALRQNFTDTWCLLVIGNSSFLHDKTFMLALFEEFDKVPHPTNSNLAGYGPLSGIGKCLTKGQSPLLHDETFMLALFKRDVWEAKRALVESKSTLLHNASFMLALFERNVGEAHRALVEGKSTLLHDASFMLALFKRIEWWWGARKALTEGESNLLHNASFMLALFKRDVWEVKRALVKGMSTLLHDASFMLTLFERDAREAKRVLVEGKSTLLHDASFMLTLTEKHPLMAFIHGWAGKLKICQLVARNIARWFLGIFRNFIGRPLS